MNGTRHDVIEMCQCSISGAAHGLSGILQMLLSFPACLQSDPAAEQDVKASVDYLLSLQTQSGNFPSAMDELGRRARSEADELVHWCHGAPGNGVSVEFQCGWTGRSKLIAIICRLLKTFQ